MLNKLRGKTAPLLFAIQTIAMTVNMTKHFINLVHFALIQDLYICSSVGFVSRW